MTDLPGANRPSTMNGHGVRPNAFDLRAEGDQELREVLDMGLAGSVAENRGSLRRCRRHQCVFGGRDARLVEKDVGTAESIYLHVDHLAVRELGAELLESEEVGIESASTNDVTAGWGEGDTSRPSEERSREQDRRAEFVA